MDYIIDTIAKESVKGDDLISREDAVNALADYIHNVDKVMGTGHLSWDDCIDSAESVLEGVPSAHLDACENTCDFERKSNDLISRADAVDAISKIKRTDNWQAAVSMALLNLPTAQPELGTQMSLADCISRADALSCFHDWIDSHGDVHTADEMPEFQRIEQLPSAQPEWNNHKVACMIAELFGDTCACNYNGIDEWLPEKCELIDACPNPVGVACWEQYLKHSAGRRTDE